MAKGSITKRAVDALKPGEKDQFLWSTDQPGFGVKITPAGKRVYVIQYRMRGGSRPANQCAPRRYTIGAHGIWTPELASRKAAELLRMVDSGTDPAGEREREAEQRRTDEALGFGEYAGRFLALYVKHEWARSYDYAERILRLHVSPRFKDKPLTAIRKADITALFDAIPGDQTALRRNVFGVIRRLFNWAVGRGDLEKSPLDGFEAPPVAESRDRVLADPELRLIWIASAGLGYPFAPFYRLLAITGQRREEVAGLDWQELDRAAATWTLPADRAKNGVTTIVHLSPLAIAELDAIAKGERWPRKGLVLSSNGKTPVSGYSKGKSRLDKAIAELAAKEAASAGEEPIEVKPWVVHDLRRTLATGMQKLGVRLEVTEAVLNHISGSKAGIVGVYQRHQWTDEKRAALDAWAAHVEKLATGTDDTNVIELAERRA